MNVRKFNIQNTAGVQLVFVSAVKKNITKKQKQTNKQKEKQTKNKKRHIL